MSGNPAQHRSARRTRRDRQPSQEPALSSARDADRCADRSGDRGERREQHPCPEGGRVSGEQRHRQHQRYRDLQDECPWPRRGDQNLAREEVARHHPPDQWNATRDRDGRAHHRGTPSLSRATPVRWRKTALRSGRWIRSARSPPGQASTTRTMAASAESSTRSRVTSPAARRDVRDPRDRLQIAGVRVSCPRR